MRDPLLTLNASQLRLLLIEKHHHFLEDYEREYEILEGEWEHYIQLKNRLSLLEEKRDQLLHWLREKEWGEETGSKEIYEEYERERKEAEKEIAHINHSLSKIGDISPKKERIELLKERIKLHKEALAYWKELEEREGKNAGK